MAGTLTHQNAIDYVRSHMKGIPISAVDSQTCHIVNSIIWRAFPWYWSVTELGAIALVDGTQDYAILDSDFYRLVSAHITRTDVDPCPKRELVIKSSLPKEVQHKRGFSSLEAISYQKSVGKLRLDHPAQVPLTVTITLDGEYQIDAPLINDAALSDPVPFDDVYFDVYVAGIMWQLMLFSNDRRAGTAVQVKSGGIQYTGQMGVFYTLLADMAESEDWGVGETEIPVNPLGVTPGTGGSFYFS